MELSGLLMMKAITEDWKRRDVKLSDGDALEELPDAKQKELIEKMGTLLEGLLTKIPASIFLALPVLNQIKPSNAKMLARIARDYCDKNTLVDLMRWFAKILLPIVAKPKFGPANPELAKQTKNDVHSICSEIATDGASVGTYNNFAYYWLKFEAGIKWLFEKVLGKYGSPVAETINEFLRFIFKLFYWSLRVTVLAVVKKGILNWGIVKPAVENVHKDRDQSINRAFIGEARDFLIDGTSRLLEKDKMKGVKLNAFDVNLKPDIQLKPRVKLTLNPVSAK
jgi:hypothetical protein